MGGLLALTQGGVFAEDFRVLSPLAEGGMGAVYRVLQLSTGSVRALKVMHPQLVSDERQRRRFIQEARVGSQIESEHVVSVVGAGVDRMTGMPWLAMEYLRGETVAQLVARKGPLDRLVARELLSQLCHALAAAHDAGIVHRDLKPENIFLAVSKRKGASATVKVLDFGIAKLVAETTGQSTSVVGTPLWMAPEQANATEKVCPATDLWAVGLIAFFMLTGHPYWLCARNLAIPAMAILAEVVFSEMPAASARAQDLGLDVSLPEGFDAWFSRCVHRDLAERYSSARDASLDFEHLIPGIASLPPSLLQVSALSDVPSGAFDVAEVAGAYEVESAKTMPAPLASASLGAFASSPGLPSTAAGASGLEKAPAAGTASLEGGAQRPASTNEILSTSASPAHGPRSETAPRSRGTGRAVTTAFVALLAVTAGVFAARAMLRWMPPMPYAGKAPTAVASTVPSAVPAVVSASSKKLDLGQDLSAQCPVGTAYVAGGTFSAVDQPQLTTVGAFCMDATEVATIDYTLCVREKKCSAEGLRADPMCNYGVRGREHHPINCVSATQADAYCQMRGKRLPTADEWRWASIGGEAGTTYPWGEQPPEPRLCWSATFPRTSLGSCDVGSHPSGAGRLQLQDIEGNVAELVTTQDGPLVVGAHWASSKLEQGRKIGVKQGTLAHLATVGFRCAVSL